MALKLLAFLLVLLLHPKTPESHWGLFRPRPPPPPPPPPFVPPPLCSSQFALVNRACARLPYTPVPPPSPPAPPSPPPPPPQEAGDGDRNGDGEEGEHHRGHRHRRHAFKETPVQEECCRWLKEVDNVCVCGVVAHLPEFMTRPVHNYTVIVDESCNVSFHCGSALRF